MARTRFGLLTAAVAVLSVLAPSAALGDAAADEPATYDRLYLLSDDGAYQYFSVDKDDPDLREPSGLWRCSAAGTVQGSRRCAAGVGSRLYSTFGPASQLLDAVTWTAADPLRFRFRMDVDTAEPYTVHAGFQQGGVTQSPAAVQVAPGVFEGAFAGAGSWSPGGGNRLYFFVSGPSGPLTVTFHMGGESWFQLPQPVRARSTADLVRASPDAAEPLTFSTPMRELWFNDANYEVVSFTGDLAQTRRFDVPTDRDATAVLAWVEVNDGAFLHNAVNDAEVDRSRLTDTPLLSLQRNGVELAAGPVQRNQRGRGNVAAAAMRVRAGTVSIEVSALDPSTTEGAAYDAHVLLLYGHRTLQRMRWRYEHANNEPFHPARTPGAGTCVNRSEPVPTSAAVSTFTVSVAWDTVGLPTAKYTVAHGFPTGATAACAEWGDGPSVRITAPREQVWVFSATPSADTTFASYRDTVFEMDVRFWYTAP